MQQISIFDLPQYPHEPGYQNTDTSLQAAIEMKPKAEVIRLRVLECLDWAGSQGRTPEEIAARIGETVLNVRPRCTELKEAGKIMDSGIRRKNENGKNTIVWVAICGTQ